MINNNLFLRVTASYDLKRMKQCRLIAVGCGGSRSFLEDMARCGVGEFVLIDPDVVEAPNIGTQQAYTDEVGKPKVECIAARIRAINPGAVIVPCQKAIEEISDDAFADLACMPLPQGSGQGSVVSLLGGFTDQFFAQARVHRLSLQFGLPSLCVQLYQHGHSGEITFSYPGVTPACQRCILSPRYKAYLERGYKNTVTSDGSPIFATARVNALKGMIALALLHHGTNHPVWGEMLSRIGNRTLVQIRMHPDTSLSIFDTVFAGGDTSRIFFDEAVWLPQEPDPDCPDCGGTGDLRNARGMFADTRIPSGLWGGYDLGSEKWVIPDDAEGKRGGVGELPEGPFCDLSDVDGTFSDEDKVLEGPFSDEDKLPPGLLVGYDVCDGKVIRFILDGENERPARVIRFIPDPFIPDDANEKSADDLPPGLWG